MTCRISSRTSRRWTLIWTLFAGLAMFLSFAGTAEAQVTASLNGTVRDTTGAVIAGADVLLHNNDTSLNRSATTNDAGYYYIADVQPGSYELKVSRQGFRTAVQTGITLVVNQTATFNLTLSPGSTTESIEVQASALALETSTSELGVAVVRQQVNDLPLNGRNFTQILNLTPGVSTVNVSQNSQGSGGIWSNPIGTFSYPSVNGQTNRSNLFLLDGINNQGSFGSTYAVAPIVDDIQEFKVQSHNDDASFGGAMGGIVNVVTKSGTNQYHGSAWEFLRNAAADARPTFLPAAAKSSFQQNQFGGTFGGPLPIPGKRMKTFFFLTYEGYRNHSTPTSPLFYIVPTATQLSGDLTGFSGQIFNPFSVVPNGASPTGFSNQPFMCDASGNPLPAPGNIQGAGTPCNKIPASMIDRNLVNYAQKLFPTPNLVGNPTFNGVDTTKTITRQDEGSARLDHQFSERDNVWARYSSFRQPASGSGGFAGLLHQQVTNGYNLGVDYIHSFSSSSLLELAFGRNNVNIDQTTNYANAGSNTGTDFGFAPNFSGNFIGGVSMIPAVVIQGFIGNPNPSAHNGAQVDNTHVSDIWQWQGNFTKTHLHHTFRMGASFATNNADALYLNSNVQFVPASTGNAANLSQLGDALASFLLGVPKISGRRNTVETEHGGWVNGFYFMDQWRATNKLSVNLGLRYDVTLVPAYGDNAHKNNMVGDTDFNTGTYILSHNAPSCLDTNAAPCIPNGVLPAHVILTPLSGGRIFHNDYSNWQPRIGLAYQLTNSTVLRAGYGRFFDNWAAITQTAQNFEGTWPDLGQLGASSLNPLTGAPSASAGDPFNLGSGSPVTTGTPFTQETWFADPHLKRPYSDDWNFGVQQEVGASSVLTLNYVGSHGGRLDISTFANTALTPGPGPIAPRTPFPYITQQAPFDRSVGRSSYNALQASLNGRGVHGLTYLISYTWSKALDIGCTGWYGVEGCSTQTPYDLNRDRGPAATDLTHIFSAAWVYELPFGKGKSLSSSNSFLNYVIGGWALNGILSFSSGQPFDVGISGDPANTGNVSFTTGYNYERLNLVGDPYPANKSPKHWLNPAGFQVPKQFTFGDLGRNSLRSDWSKNLDLSLFKRFPITENMRLEFRFEAFNVTNTPVWGIPGNNIANSNFGVVSSTVNTARQLQFGLKFYF
jgi:outer membrane receptor protein involved in Fe transport